MILPLNDGFFIESDGRYNFTVKQRFVTGGSKRGAKPKESKVSVRTLGFYGDLRHALSAVVTKAMNQGEENEVQAILAKLNLIDATIADVATRIEVAVAAGGPRLSWELAPFTGSIELRYDAGDDARFTGPEVEAEEAKAETEAPEASEDDEGFADL